MDLKSIANAAMSASKQGVTLSAESLRALDDLIGKGVFNDKDEFIAFAMKTYGEYKLSGGSAQPTQADVSKAVANTSVAKNMNPQDVRGALVPLLTSVFTSMGKNQMGF